VVRLARPGGSRTGRVEVDGSQAVPASGARGQIPLGLGRPPADPAYSLASTAFISFFMWS